MRTEAGMRSSMSSERGRVTKCLVTSYVNEPMRHCVQTNFFKAHLRVRICAAFLHYECACELSEQIASSSISSASVAFPKKYPWNISARASHFRTALLQAWLHVCAWHLIRSRRPTEVNYEVLLAFSSFGTAGLLVRPRIEARTKRKHWHLYANRWTISSQCNHIRSSCCHLQSSFLHSLATFGRTFYCSDKDSLLKKLLRNINGNSWR